MNRSSKPVKSWPDSSDGNFPFVNDDNTVAGLGDFRQDVTGDQNRMRTCEAADQFSYFYDLARVQTGNWFIKDQNGRRADQRLSDAYAFAVSQRQVSQKRLACVFQPVNSVTRRNSAGKSGSGTPRIRATKCR